MNMSKKFLLCFHDFSVWNYQKVMPVLESLKELAGRSFSILVIPCTEGADEASVQGFRQALQQLKSDGFELALHGFKHKAEFSQGRSYAGLMGMNLTGGEAEFAGLSEYESGRLFQNALGAWRALVGEDSTDKSVRPVAFVPPTWYSNKYLPSQVHAAKMLYEDRCSLTTARGKRYISPVASFAGIPKAMMKPALVFGRSIFNIPVGVPRLALHPVDFPHLEGEIRDLIRVALNRKFELAHYGEL